MLTDAEVAGVRDDWDGLSANGGAGRWRDQPAGRPGGKRRSTERHVEHVVAGEATATAEGMPGGSRELATP